LLHEGDYFERLTIYCAGCEQPMSSAFKRSALAEAKMKASPAPTS
jgi:hypothetical protein